MINGDRCGKAGFLGELENGGGGGGGALCQTAVVSGLL